MPLTVAGSDMLRLHNACFSCSPRVQAVVKSCDSARIGNNDVFYCFVEDWVADAVFKESGFPNSDVIFPAFDEEVPAYFGERIHFRAFLFINTQFSSGTKNKGT